MHASGHTTLRSSSSDVNRLQEMERRGPERVGEGGNRLHVLQFPPFLQWDVFGSTCPAGRAIEAEGRIQSTVRHLRQSAI